MNRVSDAGSECGRIEADLILLLDGGLDVLRVGEVNAHFSECARCAAFYRDLRRALVDEAPVNPGLDIDRQGFPRTDFDALAARLEAADLRALGRLLYEVLKAEFLFDYGDNVEPEDEPIADPAAERLRGAEMVEDLRDWVDGNVVEGVDLREMARRFETPHVDMDRIERLIDGMRAVARYDSALAAKADFYIGLAHIKARRPAQATAALEPLTRGGDPSLARLARITVAVLPGMLEGRPDASVMALRACLQGDALDGLVHFNLAQALFEQGGQVDAEVRTHLDAARKVDPELVERQLSVPSARRLRLALQADAQSSSVRTPVRS